MMLMGVAFMLPSHAQLLHVFTNDTTLFERGKISCQGKFTTIKLNEKGEWLFDSDNVTALTNAAILGKHFSILPVYLEPGKTAIMTISKKKDKINIKYTGDNADANRFLQKYTLLHHGKWEFDPKEFAGFTKEQLKEQEERAKREFITYEQAYKRLGDRYRATMKAASKVKDKQRRERFQKLAGMKNLANLLELHEMQAKEEHRDVKEDSSYKQLIEQIDPNDEDGLDMVLRLPQTYMKGILSSSRNQKDMTAYGLEFLDIVENNITNNRVRETLLGDLASNLLGSTSSDKDFDLDTFWEAFKKVASLKLINSVQRLVDSKRATAKGAKCPDISFSDPQGSQHLLSEYFGKVLYIDIWATWCGPCCAQIPYIEKIVAHYKDNKSIRFISISIDTDKKGWLDKIEKDKPQWLQFLCSKDEYIQLNKKWGVTSIPRFIIINADGTINNNNAFRPDDPEFIKKIDNILLKNKSSK